MNNKLTPGQIVYYYEIEQGVVKDTIVSYDEDIQMYELKDSGEFFERKDLFTNKRKCQLAH